MRNHDYLLTAGDEEWTNLYGTEERLITRKNSSPVRWKRDILEENQKAVAVRANRSISEIHSVEVEVGGEISKNITGYVRLVPGTKYDLQREDKKRSSGALLGPLKSGSSSTECLVRWG